MKKQGSIEQAKALEASEKRWKATKNKEKLAWILYQLLKDEKELDKVQDLMIKLKNNIEKCKSISEISWIINQLFVDIYKYDFATSKQLIHIARDVITDMENKELSLIAKKIFFFIAREYFYTINWIEYFNEEFMNDKTEFDLDKLLTQLTNSWDFELNKIKIWSTTLEYLYKIEKKIDEQAQTKDLLEDRLFFKDFEFVLPKNLQNIIEQTEKNWNMINCLRYLNSVFSFFSYIIVQYSSIINSSIDKIKESKPLNDKFINNISTSISIYLNFLKKFLSIDKEDIFKNPKTLTIILCNLKVYDEFLKYAKTLIKENIIKWKNESIINRIDEIINENQKLLLIFSQEINEKNITIENKILENFLDKMAWITLNQDKTINTESLIQSDYTNKKELSFRKLLETYQQVITWEITDTKEIEKIIWRILSDIKTYSDIYNMRITAKNCMHLNIPQNNKIEMFKEEARWKLKEYINKAFSNILIWPEWKVNLQEAIWMLKTAISILTWQLYDEKNMTFKILVESDITWKNKNKTNYLCKDYFEENTKSMKDIEKILNSITPNADDWIVTIFEKWETENIKGYFTEVENLWEVLIVPFKYSNFQKQLKTWYLLINFNFSNTNIKENFYIKDNWDIATTLLLIQNKHEQLKKILWLKEVVLNDLEKHHIDSAEHSKRLPLLAKILVKALEWYPEFQDWISQLHKIAERLSLWLWWLLELSWAFHDVWKKGVNLRALDSIKFSENHLRSLKEFLWDQDFKIKIETEKLKEIFNKLLNNNHNKQLIEQLIRAINSQENLMNNIYTSIDILNANTYDKSRTVQIKTRSWNKKCSINQFDLFNAYKIAYVLEKTHPLVFNELIEELNPFFELISHDQYEKLKLKLNEIDTINRESVWIKQILIILYIYYYLQNTLLKEQVKQPHIINWLRFFKEHSELQLLLWALLHHNEYPIIKDIEEYINLDIFEFYDKNKYQQILDIDKSLPISPDLKPFLSIILTIVDILDALVSSRSYNTWRDSLIENYEFAIQKLEKIIQYSNSKILSRIVEIIKNNDIFKKEILDFLETQIDKIDPNRHKISTI